MLFKINKNSIRPNPNAGHTQYYVPGKQEIIEHEDGTKEVRNNIKTVYSLTPEPKYLFEYNRADCDNCGKSISHKDLEYDDLTLMQICPECKEFLVVLYERLDDKGSTL